VSNIGPLEVGVREILNRAEKPPKVRRKFDYIIPGLRRMVEFAAARAVGPRNVPKEISKLMGFTQGAYNMKFVEFKDEAPEELEHFGITQSNLYDFCRLFEIPSRFFTHFAIFDAINYKSDRGLSDDELVGKLNDDDSAHLNVQEFERLVAEFWRDSKSEVGYQNLAFVAQQASSANFVSIAQPGHRGAAPLTTDTKLASRTFSYDDPYVIEVQIEQPDWYCALMEMKDDPYIMPSFVMIHGPELQRTDALGSLTMPGTIGEPSGRFRLLSFSFDPNLRMPEWAEVSAGSQCPTLLISKIVKLLSSSPESCRLMISNPYEVYPR
jgi:hypothetical protein